MTTDDIETALDEAETAEPKPVRRVVQETEEPTPCGLCGGNGCLECGLTGVGKIWRVTSRTVQVGVPYNEQAADAYIRTLHMHIRKAAATVSQAGDILMGAGRLKEAGGMKAAAKAILDILPEQG